MRRSRRGRSTRVKMRRNGLHKKLKKRTGSYGRYGGSRSGGGRTGGGRFSSFSNLPKFGSLFNRLGFGGGAGRTATNTLSATQTNQISQRTGRVANSKISSLETRSVLLELLPEYTVNRLPIFIATVPIIITNITVQGASILQTFAEVQVEKVDHAETAQLSNNNSAFNNQPNTGIFNITPNEFFQDTRSNNTLMDESGDTNIPDNTDAPTSNPVPINVGIILLRKGIPVTTMVSNFQPPANISVMEQEFNNFGSAGLNDSSLIYTPQNELLWCSTLLPYAARGVGMTVHTIDHELSDYQANMTVGDRLFLIERRTNGGLHIVSSLIIKIEYKSIVNSTR